DCAAAVVQRDAHPDLGGGGVFGNIVQSFLCREEQIVTLLRGERAGRQAGGQVQAAADARRTEETLRVFAEVSDQAGKGVMLGVDCPDDFVHRAEDFAGGAQDTADVFAGRVAVREVAIGQFAQQRDLRQTRSQIV